MLKQITAPDHVASFSLSGTLSSGDVREYSAVLGHKLQEHDQVGLLVDMTGMADMSKQALIDGFKADTELLGHLKQIGHCALVSDKQWLQGAVSLAQQFLPTLRLRVFASTQHDQALAWAAQTLARPTSTPAAIRFLPTNRDDVLAFEVDGLMTAGEMPDVIRHVDGQLAAHDKLRMLARIKNFDGFEPSILTQSGLIPMKFSAMKKVERYAVVGAPGWMRKLVTTMAPVIPGMTMRTFDAGDEADAWAWLEAAPAD